VWQDLCDEIAFDFCGQLICESLVPQRPSSNDTGSSDSSSDSSAYHWHSSERGKSQWFCELCRSFQPEPPRYQRTEHLKLCFDCRIGSFLVEIKLSTHEVVKRAYRGHVDDHHANQVIFCQSHADDDYDDDNYVYDSDDDDDDDDDSDDDDDGIHRKHPDCGSTVSDPSHSVTNSR
jgi:hypothetical protein